MSGIQDLLDVARSQLGVHEDPPYSNRVKYTEAYGMVGPWCDMYVWWCGRESGNEVVIGRFAFTPSHEAWFRAQGREVAIRDAQPGDIVFFNFIGRTSHVGIVEANRGDGLVTIEGNTNGSGSRDGGSVIRHFRSWSSGIVSVHRPAYSNEGEFVMDADAKAAFFGTNIRILQVEERAIKREMALFERERKRDKARWRKLWDVLNVAVEADEDDEERDREMNERLIAVQTELQSQRDLLNAL